jgi:acyl-CoA reductase-like NAD-dependent aldehyde dehydrogenase
MAEIGSSSTPVHACSARDIKIPETNQRVVFTKLTRTARDSPPAIMSVEVIRTISPTTDEPILTRNGISPQDLEQLPEIATRAFDLWRKTTLQQRQDIIKKALKILDQRKDELATELTVQMGRPIAYTPKEIATAIKRAEYLLKVSEDVLQDTPGEAEKGFKRFIRKVPVGPVLIIFAWNVRVAPG